MFSAACLALALRHSALTPRTHAISPRVPLRTHYVLLFALILDGDITFAALSARYCLRLPNAVFCAHRQAGVERRGSVSLCGEILSESGRQLSISISASKSQVGVKNSRRRSYQRKICGGVIALAQQRSGIWQRSKDFIIKSFSPRLRQALNVNNACAIGRSRRSYINVRDISSIARAPWRRQ